MSDSNENSEVEETEKPIEERTCFIVSPIGEDGSPTRKRADQVLKHIILPALIESGYSEGNIKRADKISDPGNITYQVIDYIIESDLVIADLTERNANVFYELAIRHALRKPYIQISEADTVLPFDIQSLRTIKFDHKDLDSADSAREQIVESVNALNQKENNLMTPIHEGLEIHDLIQSDKPIEQALGNIYNIISRLNEKVDNIEKKNSITLDKKHSYNTAGREFFVSDGTIKVDSDFYSRMPDNKRATEYTKKPQNDQIGNRDLNDK